jgi:hypothetical protein
MCSCGWSGRPRLLLSSAKLDALIHAAARGCGTAVPLVQPEAITVVQPPGILITECPAGCGATILVPVTITDTLSAGCADGALCIRFTAEAPELHDTVNHHLQTCPSATSWADVALARSHS